MIIQNGISITKRAKKFENNINIKLTIIKLKNDLIKINYK
jgi:hypothetical protein